jgi:transposase
MANVQEKAKCVLWFFETKSVIKTQRRFRTQYGKDPPSDNAIRRWLKQFKETGCVLHRKGAGRPSISQEDVDRIQEAFSESPQKSTRQAALQLGIPQTTVWRVLHNRLDHRDSTGNKT